MLLTEKGARGKGRQPLPPPSTGETRSAVSAPDIGSKFCVARRSTLNLPEADFWTANFLMVRDSGAIMEVPLAAILKCAFGRID